MIIRSNKLNSELPSGYGFTLIELSIVLIIIGLIAGGALVGQDLIKAAEIRAQISQFEKYNTAVNTFRGKYGYLPGDIPDPYATQFGFIARGTSAAQGDGNGIIQGYSLAFGASGSFMTGENLTFWVDLSKAELIEGGFNSASSTSYSGSDVTGNNLANYLPKAKIGNANYVYLDSDSGFSNNTFVISQAQSLAYSSWYSEMVSNKGLSVLQAQNIDKKIDNGLPLSGKIIAASPLKGDYYYSNSPAGVRDTTQWLWNYNPNTSAISVSSSTCYDNNNNTANTMQYSVGQNNGAGINCNLSFRHNFNTSLAFDMP